MPNKNFVGPEEFVERNFVEQFLIYNQNQPLRVVKDGVEDGIGCYSTYTELHLVCVCIV